jgi:predicted small lipoprotein YifL
MKKSLFFLLIIIALFTLSACNDSGPRLKTPLEKALHHIQNADNYQLNIEINLDFVRVDLSILFDQNIIRYDFVDDVIYFVREKNDCIEYTSSDGVFLKQIIPCEMTSMTYGFYLNFTPSMFESHEQMYQMRSEHFDVLNQFFAQTLLNPSVSNVFLILRDNQVEQLLFKLQADEDVYDFILTFTNFDLIEVDLPKD